MILENTPPSDSILPVVDQHTIDSVRLEYSNTLTNANKKNRSTMQRHNGFLLDTVQRLNNFFGLDTVASEVSTEHAISVYAMLHMQGLTDQMAQRFSRRLLSLPTVGEEAPGSLPEAFNYKRLPASFRIKRQLARFATRGQKSFESSALPLVVPSLVEGVVDDLPSASIDLARQNPTLSLEISNEHTIASFNVNQTIDFQDRVRIREVTVCMYSLLDKAAQMQQAEDNL